MPGRRRATASDPPLAADAPQPPIVEVTNLTVRYRSGERDDREVRAVEDVSFSLRPGEALGLVGESGCGKTTIGLALLRILPPAGRVVAGDIRFAGQSLLAMAEQEVNRLRWKQIAMVFQGALGALNPVRRVVDQVAEPIRVHDGASASEARERARHLLNRVGIGDRHLDGYPHEYSGGMVQRAVLAMALACRPRLIVADEPGTALDVVLQAQMLALLRSLRAEYGLTTLIVSHDLAAIATLTDRCAVMYAGRIVEYGDTARVLNDPRHPYTQALLSSYPQLHADEHDLRSIPGNPPSLADLPPGCPFQPRCRFAHDICTAVVPELRAAAPDHLVRCVLVPDRSSPANLDQRAPGTAPSVHTSYG